MQDFRHEVDVQVRYGDVDMLGHVNNANYITYVEEARIQYARDVFGWDGQPSTLGLIVARISIDYLQPLYSGQVIRTYTRCTRLGNKSFDLAHRMVRVTDEATAASVETTLVAYDALAESSHPVPDRFRQGIINFEQVPPEGSHET